MWGIFKKDVKELFFSNFLLGLTLAFLISAASLFYINIILTNTLNYQPFFANLVGLTMVFAPFFCMRLLGLEKSKKTFLLLMLSPRKKITFIMTRYLSLAFYFFMITFFMLFFFGMIYVTRSFYLPVIFLGFLKINLLFLFILALGSCLSVWSKGYVTNALSVLVIIFFFYFLHNSSMLDSDFVFLNSFLEEINPFSHLENFALGILNGKDIAYFVIAIFSLLTSAGVFLENKTIGK